MSHNKVLGRPAALVICDLSSAVRGLFVVGSDSLLRLAGRFMVIQRRDFILDCGGRFAEQLVLAAPVPRLQHKPQPESADLLRLETTGTATNSRIRLFRRIKLALINISMR